MTTVDRKVRAMVQVIQGYHLEHIEKWYYIIANLVMKYGGIIKGAPFSTTSGQDDSVWITMIIYFELPIENIKAFAEEIKNENKNRTSE